MDNDQRDTLSTRELILERALALFSARGYDAVGIQEVAEHSGVTKPTLYYWFRSKRGLLDAIAAGSGADYAALVEREAVYHGDIVRTLETLAIAIATFADSQRDFYRMLLALWFAPPESEGHKAFLDVHVRAHTAIAACFLAAAADHGNMRKRHERYAVSYLGMVNTWVGHFLNGYGEFSPAAVRTAVGQYMHGIFS